MKPISSGAEAVIYKKNKTAIKHRVKKSYRHKDLDLKLRTQRTNREAKVLKTLEKLNFPGPRLTKQEKDKLHMTYLDGTKLKGLKIERPIAQELGKKLTILHNNNIIHGDLTTSNIILTDQIHFIDFGLSSFSNKPEDKAVDLKLLLTNINNKALENDIMKEYKKEIKDKRIIPTLIKVQKRGRNKH